MPPIAPHIPPKPTTEPTARFGNMSDASVKTLQDQPWCAAAARPTSMTATHSWVAWAASGIGTTASAHTSIAVLRERFTLQPRLIRADDSHPPPMLPTVG